MLPVKRGLPALARASSSQTVLRVYGTSSRRFYADDTKGKDTNRNAAYSKILSAEDNADKEVIDDVLGLGRAKAPDSPPRYSGVKLPPSNRTVKAAPMAPATSTSGGLYQIPQRPKRPILSDATDLSLDPGNRGFDDADRKANEVFGGVSGYDQSSGDGKEKTIFNVLYRLHVMARSKNCIMTLCDENYKRVLITSSGRNKFKNVTEGTYEAGYQCALRVFETLKEEKKRRKEGMKLHIFLNGFGQGRSALLKALTMSEGDGIRQMICKLSDTTPIKIGGVRLQKSRRL